MSTYQHSFDWTGERPPAVQEKINRGMAQADDHAKQEWKREVDGCIRAVALRKSFFTADDVYDELERNHKHFTTHNLSALGPRMKEVAKTLGYMVATDRVQRSVKPEKHGNLMRVWQSRIFIP